MKTSILISGFLILLVSSGFIEARGQWAYSGSNIYNTNSGNVGIGTNAPSTLLYVSKNMTEPTVTIRNQGGIGGATYAMIDDASGANWKFKATIHGGFKIRDHATGLDVLVIEPNSATNAICIKNTGNIGIGTALPSNSALIEMYSFTKGFLIPRMTLAQINSIPNPASGLMVFNTTSDDVFAYFPGSGGWKKNLYGSGAISPISAFICGSNITINHVAGPVVPVSKTVTYGTVLTNLTGSNKCWIIQNLGADQPANAVNDATEPSAGWYWQFNRPQGYKHDGATRTPNTNWITGISQNSEWTSANDPCYIELGNTWRLPTYSEWTNVMANGGWTDWNGPWNSTLALHAAGNLNSTTGVLNWRGQHGDYWSNTQASPSNGWLIEFGGGPGECTMFNYDKSNGFPVRCIQSPPQVPCGNSFTVAHWAGNVAPVNKIVQYGTVTNIPGELTKCWITSNLGANRQATAVNDATEASAGWYWQFNRPQGFKYEGTTRTPNTTWIYSINENSDWLATNDPCNLEFGNGWRLPTSTEWANVDASGNWNHWDDPWNSPLKIHAAGFLSESSGTINYRGARTAYWSNTQNSLTDGRYLFAMTGESKLENADKAYGFSARCIQDPSAFSCGSALNINHLAGNVAPVSKNVSYGTVITNLTGSHRCWITQNLGASNQATSVSDATEASAGWYWQFNRPQGYMHDGVTRTPNTAWVNLIDEHSNWLAANDPCALELGGNWRIPTYTEWNNTIINGGWTDWNVSWNSALKLHAAGDIDLTGALNWRGAFGDYWSSSQGNDFKGGLLELGNTYVTMFGYEKAYGFSIRCIEASPEPAFTCGSPLFINHVAGNVAPVGKMVMYGTVNNIPGETGKCWITQNLGADQQATAVSDATEASAGWYWQFNRMQGYKHDGVNVTPAWSNTVVYENYDWEPANDPCALELGFGWHVPTATEWINVDAAGNWTDWNGPWNSALKIHAAGFLDIPDGALTHRGTHGFYWSSSQDPNQIDATILYFISVFCVVNQNYKTLGYPVRCVR